jgi:hypothetical protein
MKLGLILGIALAAVGVTAAPTARAACCPNGVYTGNIANACSTGKPGDGMCWNNFQIQCNQTYAFVGFNNQQTTQPPDANVGDCYNFCQTYGGSYTTVNLAIGLVNNVCTCLSSTLSLTLDVGLGTSLVYCPTSGPIPTPPCCTPYAGTLNTACTGSQPGNGLCLTGGYQILCNGTFNTVPGLNVAHSFQACQTYCNTNFAGWGALQWTPGAISILDGCGCAATGVGFTPNTASLSTAWSINKSKLQVCGAASSSSTST